MQFPDELPRPLLVLTGIVAVVALFIGIKDYFAHPKNSGTSATPSAATEVNSKATTARKKTVSPKPKGARMSPNETSAQATEQAAPGEMEKQIITEEFAKSLAAHNEAVASMDRNNQVDELEAVAAPGTVRPGMSPKECLPLPNMTKPEDPDAAYYMDWAKEYACFY